MLPAGLSLGGRNDGLSAFFPFGALDIAVGHESLNNLLRIFYITKGVYLLGAMKFRSPKKPSSSKMVVKMVTNSLELF